MKILNILTKVIFVLILVSGCAGTPEVSTPSQIEKVIEVPRKLDTTFLERGFPFNYPDFRLPDKSEYGCGTNRCRCSFMSRLLLHTQWQLHDPAHPHLDIQVKFGTRWQIAKPAIITVQDNNTGKFYGFSVNRNLCSWTKYNKIDRQVGFYGIDGDEVSCWKVGYSQTPLVFCFKKINHIYHGTFYLFAKYPSVMYNSPGYRTKEITALEFHEMRYNPY